MSSCVGKHQAWVGWGWGANYTVDLSVLSQLFSKPVEFMVCAKWIYFQGALRDGLSLLTAVSWLKHSVFHLNM